MSPHPFSKPGTLVHARGREWFVLPDSGADMLLVRPVGGLDEEVTGILTAVEPVESSTFDLPTVNDLGDFTAGRFLREAARLSTRSAAGPFRCFGRIATEPRPYQLVPLIMALKVDPIRLLIADDVGIGKTIEATLIARELLDRGEIRRLTVLCPPQLAEQWQKELAEKFHIEAELILSSTIQKLERDLPLGVSVFDQHKFTVVSTDFIKSPRRAEDFIIKCPEFVIVDEAHGCTLADGLGRGRQQRFDLLRRISKDQDRHLVLVTATPHSGKEEAFRSLLSLLRDEFASLPNKLDQASREGIRRNLAQHMIQRRRADIRNYLETDTSFPERKDKESTYTFSTEYRRLFESILKFARDYVSESDESTRHQRVKYWSALALLRCVSSSPAAAAATLRNRAAVDEVEEPEKVEEVGRQTVLDQDDTDDVAVLDFSPGSMIEGQADSTHRKLLEFARQAEKLSPEADHKLQGAMHEVQGLLRDGFRPIVFCRFVDTAEYVADHLRTKLGSKVRIETVTGRLPAAEREARICSLVADGGQYVLVSTDCLAEGINLQDNFDSILHYDLVWNPTRHEQREGRVDRFGQNSPEVRVITYYGTDNPIDGVILDVLIRKHKSIKSDLGVTVAVPGSSEQIAETLFEGALFREQTGTLSSRQAMLPFIDDLEPKKKALHEQWENARDREKASRSRFAQHVIKPEAVAEELANVRAAIGASDDVAGFFCDVMRKANVPLEANGKSVKVHISPETPRGLRQAMGQEEPFSGRFELPLREGEVYLGRTSPIVEGVASWTLDQALDYQARDAKPVAARCGVVATSAVSTRTTLIVARFRYHLQKTAASDAILCEEVLPLACRGPAEKPEWLLPDESEKLLNARPERNLIPTAIDQQIGLLMNDLPQLRQSLTSVAQQRAMVQLAAHERVRGSLRSKARISIEPVLPVDILGAYIMLPRN